MLWPQGLKKYGLTDRGVATGVTKSLMAAGGLIISVSVLKYFKYGNPLNPLVPLLGGGRRVRLRVFCRKWNSQQILLQAFFHIFDIFGSVEP